LGQLEFSQAAVPQRRMRDRYGSGNLEPTGTGFYASSEVSHSNRLKGGPIFCLLNAENRADRIF